MQQGHRSTSSTTNTARSTTDRDNSKVELMQSFFDEAKRFVGKALKSDEKGDRMGALELYNKALNAIQSGLGAIKTSDHVTSSMKELKRKLDKLKDQVKNRMELLLDEEASSRNDSSQSSCHGNSKPLPATTKETVTAEADIIFSSSKGCRLIRVDDKGIVLSYISADSLNIFKYKNHIPGQPPAFLQCGDFVYPLIPGQSPVLRSSYKAYMFPDVESDNGNVGIFFNELPKEELKNLNHTLAQLSDFKESDTNYTGSNTTTGSSIASTAYSTSGSSTSGAGPTGSTGNNEDDDKATPTWGSSISEKIDSGVEWLSSALSNGTSKTQDYMNRGGDKVRDNVEPREEPVNVPVPIEKGFHYTRIVSGGVVSVSNFLMMSLAKGTVAVGKKVGTVVAESDFMKDREVNPHISETWKVTKSSVKGAGHVFSDLEESARAIIRGASLETSKTVGHKYGGQVGHISDDGMRTAGNAVDLASTYWNWKTLGISFITKVGKVLGNQGEGEKEKDDVVSKEVSVPVKDKLVDSPSVTKHHHQPYTVRIVKSNKDVLNA